MNLNKVMLAGRLTADPELKRFDEKTVCNFSLAINKSWNNKDGEKVEKTTFVNIAIWGKNAVNCEKYLSKGSIAYVEGEIDVKEYEKDGVSKKSFSVLASRVQFIETDQNKDKEKAPDFDF